jgi:hypothetical protein
MLIEIVVSQHTDLSDREMLWFQPLGTEGV